MEREVKGREREEMEQMCQHFLCPYLYITQTLYFMEDSHENIDNRIERDA